MVSEWVSGPLPYCAVCLQFPNAWLSSKCASWSRRPFVIRNGRGWESFEVPGPRFLRGSGFGLEMPDRRGSAYQEQCEASSECALGSIGKSGTHSGGGTHSEIGGRFEKCKKNISECEWTILEGTLLHFEMWLQFEKKMTSLKAISIPKTFVAHPIARWITPFPKSVDVSKTAPRYRPRPLAQDCQSWSNGRDNSSSQRCSKS